MLVLTEREVRSLLDPDALVEALATAMGDLSAGKASVPPRVGVGIAEREAMLAAMPAFLPSAGALETKLVSVFPHNAGTPLPTHQAVIVVFDPATGRPEALLDGASITEARTAAGSALSARLLARPDAGVLGILGTGVQARAHAVAVARVRPFREVRVAGRDPAKAVTLAGEVAAEVSVPVRAAASFEEAVRGADVVCACTHSPDPVVRREWLAAGAHVTSVGFHPVGAEVDQATIAAALVVVESRAAALAPYPAGCVDLGWALRDGLIRTEDVVEIGELIAGTREGRGAEEQLTLYRSVGVGVQDAAAAALVLSRAGAAGLGTRIEL